jgi:anti-sigma regulatory factor (Ser/Thr protein kinase)
MMTSPTVDDFVVTLSGGVEAGPAARAAVTGRTAGLPDTVQADILLLVTELVTNAVRHGGVGADASLRLECRTTGDRLRFLVTDPGRKLLENGGPPSRFSRRANGGSSGWGLFFVEEIAERWGVLPAPLGTSVWFEIAV